MTLQLGHWIVFTGVQFGLSLSGMVILNVVLSSKSDFETKFNQVPYLYLGGVCTRRPDCKVCYARRRSSQGTFGCVRRKYIGYILSAQYFAKNSICRVEKLSKCKILKTIRYWNACPPCGHIFWLLSHSFHSRINGHLNGHFPCALSKLCNLARRDPIN